LAHQGVEQGRFADVGLANYAAMSAAASTSPSTVADDFFMKKLSIVDVLWLFFATSCAAISVAFGFGFFTAGVFAVAAALDAAGAFLAAAGLLAAADGTAGVWVKVAIRSLC
jgi:hypothetical protein